MRRSSTSNQETANVSPKMQPRLVTFSRREKIGHFGLIS
jgi:hypothetical protein